MVILSLAIGRLGCGFSLGFGGVGSFGVLLLLGLFFELHRLGLRGLVKQPAVSPASTTANQHPSALFLFRVLFMARIRGTDTSPEVTLRRAPWSRGLRYSLHARTPAGRPDVVLPASRVAVFIDGCFWHGCPLHYARPRSREEFWSAKARAVKRWKRQERQETSDEP